MKFFENLKNWLVPPGPKGTFVYAESFEDHDPKGETYTHTRTYTAKDMTVSDVNVFIDNYSWLGWLGRFGLCPKREISITNEHGKFIRNDWFDREESSFSFTDNQPRGLRDSGTIKSELFRDNCEKIVSFAYRNETPPPIVPAIFCTERRGHELRAVIEDEGYCVVNKPL